MQRKMFCEFFWLQQWFILEYLILKSFFKAKMKNYSEVNSNCRFSTSRKERTRTGAVDVRLTVKMTMRKESLAVMVTCATVVSTSNLHSLWR